MRPIRFLLLTCFLLHIHDSFAGDADPLRHSLKLTWAPASLFDPWGSQLMPGAEYGLSNRVSLSGSAGIPLLFSSPLITGQYISFSKDFKTRLEFRYCMKQEAKRRFFVGAEVFYRLQRYSIEKSAYWFNVSSYQYDRMNFARATVNKDMLGGGFLFGGSVQLSGRFWFEYYFGIGVKAANVTYTDVQDPSVQRGNKRYTDFTAGYNADFEREGSIVSPHVPVGLKLTYVLSHGKK